MPELADYRSRAIRALVLLHDRQLRIFFERWRQAKATNLALPQTTNPNYESLAALLRHAMLAARGYLTWVCDKLELPDPELPPVPAVEEIEGRAEEYLEEILAAWRVPLRDVPSERLADRSYEAGRGPERTILAELEHAVVHPMRHTFQLDELMEAQSG